MNFDDAHPLVGRLAATYRISDPEAQAEYARVLMAYTADIGHKAVTRMIDEVDSFPTPAKLHERCRAIQGRSKMRDTGPNEGWRDCRNKSCEHGWVFAEVDQHVGGDRMMEVVEVRPCMSCRPMDHTRWSEGTWPPKPWGQ